MIRGAAALAAGLALAAPAAALAQEPAASGAAVAAQQPAPPPPAPEPAPAAPAPEPAAAALSARLSGVHRVRRAAAVLEGGSFRVAGVLAPVVAGERVVLRITTGRRVRTRRVPVAPDGSFRAVVRAGRPGRLRVRALHRATAALSAARARRLTVSVLSPRAASGARGPLVRLLQRGLDRLRYAVPRSGVYDAGTARAVMAFRKVGGLPRRYDADATVVRRVLAGRGAFRPRHPRAGRHAEADISRQVLALVDGRQVFRVYHTSSGAPATPTVIGSFRVYLKTRGANLLGMVHSSYFIRGYAIHGYVDVPAFTASHGCLRVPIANARQIFDWLRLGDRVIVYP